ncbi:type III secretion system stalk subunit SctO [Paracoccus sp. (in: a-proteobacteria)]|uniref:type III secretion system stalk subunit SctO n=1 Tax=Paracoccus sp. TaxID=267 RepID=UPI003A851251
MSKNPLKQANQLVRLAELREDLAQRGVSAALMHLQQRIAERDECIEAARKLAEEQAEQRQVLRNELLGSPQLRGAVEAVLESFGGDRRREQEQAEALQQAEARIAEAQTKLDEARTALARAARNTEKRRKLRSPLIDVARRADERREEQEIEELQQNRRGGVIT